MRGRLRPLLPLLQRLPLNGTETPLLVVVTGPPGSGKTTIAREVGRRSALPVITKDDIKERLFDSLGWSDRDWSRRLGVATFPLLYYFVERQLEARLSVVVEANFEERYAGPAFRAIHERFPFRSLQIYCTAPASLLLDRYAQRVRHPGHVDQVVLDEVRSGLEEDRWRPLDIGGRTVSIETASFSEPELQQLAGDVHRELARLS